MNMHWISLISLPIIGGFIGWITNWVAIKMLFHPREEHRVLGLRIQGVFPRRQNALAQRLGDVVSDELLSIEDITKRIDSEALMPRISAVLDQYLETILLERLPKSIPMLAMVMSPALLQTVKDALHADLRPVVDSVLQEVGSNLGSSIDIREIVRKRVEALPSSKVEDLLEALMKQEFTFIEIVGAVLGFLIGIVQVLLTLVPG